MQIESFQSSPPKFVCGNLVVYSLKFDTGAIPTVQITIARGSTTSSYTKKISGWLYRLSGAVLMAWAMPDGVLPWRL